MADANSTAPSNTPKQQAAQEREEFRMLVEQLTESQRQWLIRRFRPFAKAAEVHHG